METEKPSAQELLNCPFCDDNSPITFKDPIYGEMIACSKPRCGGHEIRMTPNKWNVRANPAPVPARYVLPSGDKSIDIQDVKTGKPYTRPITDWWWLEFKLKEKRRNVERLEDQIKTLKNHINTRPEPAQSINAEMLESLKLLYKHTAIWNNPCTGKDAEISLIVKDVIKKAEAAMKGDVSKNSEKLNTSAEHVKNPPENEQVSAEDVKDMIEIMENTIAYAPHSLFHDAFKVVKDIERILLQREAGGGK